MHEINKILKNLRRQKKYTQAYIADRLGVTTRAYSKIESGETNLTIEKLYRITDILDVHLSHLFDSDIVTKDNSQNNTTVINNTNIISLMKDYQETIALLKEQNELLKKLLNKES